MIFLYILFFLSGFCIFWPMIGYPLFIKILDRKGSQQLTLNYDFKPSVTIMVVAHNEEEVIEDKLKNILDINYPEDKLKIIVTSDFSTDRTNEIVEEFIAHHPERDIRLHKTINHLGKTNAQNEAQKMVTTEFLVMTDANSMLSKNSITELMAAFSKEDIAYVTGVLKYVNKNVSEVADSESTYWEQDVTIRDVEGRYQSITAGNGALYAIRNKDYHDFNPIECHDSSMPFFYALQGKRSINCMGAVAYEKAGETVDDEFKRKVRMNRIILISLFNTFKILNIFKYRWFTVFYVSHRTLRYLLWFNHALLFISTALLSLSNVMFFVFLMVQFVFYFISFFAWIRKSNSKLLKLCGYYIMTICAQIFAVYKSIFGLNSATWEKAQSTR